MVRSTAPGPRCCGFKLASADRAWYAGTMTGARIIDGKALAERIKQETAATVRALGEKGVAVSLDAVLVGDPAAGEIYARSQRQRCHEVGITYRLHTLSSDAREDDIRGLIRELNVDRTVTGILLNLPLPPGLDTPAIQ